ncbi:hypothetical protein NDI52_16540 [Leptolyngbya sp. PL-A3]
MVDPIRQQIQVSCRKEAVLALATTYQRGEGSHLHLLILLFSV